MAHVVTFLAGDGQARSRSTHLQRFSHIAHILAARACHSGCRSRSSACAYFGAPSIRGVNAKFGQADPDTEGGGPSGPTPGGISRSCGGLNAHVHVRHGDLNVERKGDKVHA